MGTGDSGTSPKLAINPPVYHAGACDEVQPESPCEEHADEITWMASPKVKPRADPNANLSTMFLESTIEVDEEEHVQEKPHVQKKQKKSGLSKKFMSMSNLLEEVGDDEATDVSKVDASAPHASSEKEGEEASSMALLHASHRPLDHTVGTVKPGLKKSQSQMVLELVSDDDDEVLEPSPGPREARVGDHLLVVFDMDRTMVGDLVSLSDRDNIETNIDWSWWPEGKHRGLSVEEIIPYLKRGMVRPGLIKFVEYLRDIGATIVVYTHSELRWAQKVTTAIEEIAGFKFIRKLFARHDCKDGHAHFPARKSLQYITSELNKEEGLEWVSVDRSIMFDDDGNVLGGGDQVRLVRVPTYDYWEPCQWDEVVTQDLLDKNDPELVDIVYQSVIEWGVVRPSYLTAEEDLTEEEREKDTKWAEKLQKKQQLQLSYNKVAKLDRLWQKVREVFEAVPDLEEENMDLLPVRVRRALGNNAKLMHRHS